MSTTWHIKQDGTGNFTTIQEGIIAATDNDTILVYPGIYYENIDYLEKSLTVASLYIITPEDSLINQTIIDGNQQLRCITIEDCENASIIGFTIQNGYALQDVANGYEGGGIFIEDVTNSIVSNCKIKNNKSYTGGGIYIRHGNIDLVGNIISNNHCIGSGGGIYFHNVENALQFDENELNSIFLNYSGTGTDLYLSSYIEFTEIIVDTFTVVEPDYFFIACPDSLYSISILNSKIEEIGQDLYVSPVGNDTNSGLAPDDPLQTIAWAQTLIKRNDENPNTIHLAEGVYSPSLNDQIFPLNVKHGVVIKGESLQETILDAEEESPFVFQFARDQSEFARLVMRDLKMVNGAHINSTTNGGIRIYQADLNLTNVIIENSNSGNGGQGSAIQISNGYSYLENVIIKNSVGGQSIYNSIEYNCPNPVMDVSINNSIIEHNYPGGEYHSGGAIIVRGHSNIPGDYNARLIGCEIIENYNDYYYGGLGGPSGLGVTYMDSVDVVNCTFGDNATLTDYGCTISVRESELNIYNSIVYDNEGNALNLLEDGLVNISYSLIEGGYDSVYYYDPFAIVNWLEGNIDEDPLWTGTGGYPYSLQSGSPCIDAGTLDLPAGIELPLYDMAGNPRISGDTVDMGACEYQDSVSVQEELITSIKQTQISNYPNPFNPATTIKLELAEAGKIDLSIYNIKGQKVKTLLDAFTEKGNFEIIWRGVDENDNKVASGNYFIKLKVNGEERTYNKCVLLK